MKRRAGYSLQAGSLAWVPIIGEAGRKNEAWKHSFCKFGLFQRLSHPIVLNKTGYVEIIFKLTNDCRDVSLFYHLVGRFHHFTSYE